MRLRLSILCFLLFIEIQRIYGYQQTENANFEFEKFPKVKDLSDTPVLEQANHNKHTLDIGRLDDQPNASMISRQGHAAAFKRAETAKTTNNIRTNGKRVLAPAKPHDGDTLKQIEESWKEAQRKFMNTAKKAESEYKKTCSEAHAAIHRAMQERDYAFKAVAEEYGNAHLRIEANRKRAEKKHKKTLEQGFRALEAAQHRLKAKKMAAKKEYREALGGPDEISEMKREEIIEKYEAEKKKCGEELALAEELWQKVKDACGVGACERALEKAAAKSEAGEKRATKKLNEATEQYYQALDRAETERRNALALAYEELDEAEKVYKAALEKSRNA